MSVSEFFYMGGYGLYVWASFGATALLIAAEIIYVRRQRVNAIHRLRRLARINTEVKNET